MHEWCTHFVFSSRYVYGEYSANKSSVAVVKLSETNLKLVKGKQKKIKVTVKNVSKLKKVTFKSKNKKIASVTSKVL